MPEIHHTARVASAARDGRGDDLAARLSDVARDLQGENNVDDTLMAITAAAVGTVPGAQHAALSVVERRREVRTRAWTDEVCVQVDQAQYDSGQGPCLSAMYEQRTVRLSDMTTEPRWPEFTRRTVALGVLSMLSFQLYVRRDTLGALNLYSAERDAFDADSEHVGLLFAAHAAVAMSGAQQQEHMDRAVAARDTIGQAKGILMERYRLTAEQAFALLSRVSQQSNTRLIDVARDLTRGVEIIQRRRP